MPKQAKSFTAKVRQICQEYPDEFSATPARDLRCNLCDVLVKCDKKFFVESHRKSKQPQRKSETKNKSQSKQTFLQLIQVNFKEQIVSSFLAADIPLHKLNHSFLKSLFATMGKVLPSETAARACVAKLAYQKEVQIQKLLRDKKIILIVDEAEIAKQKYISVLVGSLDAPNQTFLVDCHTLDSGSNVNSSIILHTVDDKKDFHDAGLPSPPDPVITRWATWLRATLYYSENLPAVRTIVNNWTSAGLLVSRTKDAINVENLVPDLVKTNQYRTLAANVEFLEGSVYTITEAYGLLKNMQFDDDPCAIKNYIKKRLSNSDLETTINCTNLTIDPTSYALLQKAQPTSAAVERSFSMLSKLLRKDRNFDVKNVKNI